MADSKDKNKTSGWSIVLYVIGAIIAVLVLYFLFEQFSRSSGNGSKDNKRGAMILVAIVMGIVILYAIFSTVVDSYSNTMAGEPWLVENTKSANTMAVVPGSEIPRSTDGRFGIEFSYSFWMFIGEWGGASRYKSGQHHILHKGSITSIPDQCPGIWLKRDTNVLVVKMNTFHKNNSAECTGYDIPNNTVNEKCYLETCQIPNIPVHKWVHITVSVINRNVDVYVNGFLKKRCLLKGLPRQNDGDVYINAFGGFDGFISRARYYNYALPVWKIESVISQGPSEAPCTNTTTDVPPYLARDFWMTTRYSQAGP